MSGQGETARLGERTARSFVIACVGARRASDRVRLDLVLAVVVGCRNVLPGGRRHLRPRRGPLRQASRVGRAGLQPAPREPWRSLLLPRTPRRRWHHQRQRRRSGRLLGPLHDLRLELRPDVHGRHGLHDGDVRELLHRPLPLRRVGHQRGSASEIQRGHLDNAARIGFGGGRLPVYLVARPVLSRRQVHGGVLLTHGHPPCLLGRWWNVRLERCHDVQQGGPTRRLRLLRRNVLRAVAGGSTNVSVPRRRANEGAPPPADGSARRGPGERAATASRMDSLRMVTGARA